MRSSFWQQQQKRRKENDHVLSWWWSFCSLVVVVLVLLGCGMVSTNAIIIVESFLITTTKTKSTTIHDNTTSRTQGTCLFAAKRTKLSFAQRKKQRGRKQASSAASSASFKFPVVGNATLSQQEQATVTKTTTTNTSKDDTSTTHQAVVDDEDARVKAAKLIEAQRDSIQTLTHVRKCIEHRGDWEAVAQQLVEQGYAVIDNFLIPAKEEQNSAAETNVSSTKELPSEIGTQLIQQMFQEGVSLKINGLSELTSIGSGLYQFLLKGGDSYNQSPRCIEYCVSLTKHLPTALLTNGEKHDDMPHLDNTASMSMMQTFDKKSKLASLELLMGKDAIAKYVSEQQQQDDDTPYQTVVSDTNNEDQRKLTCVYYLLDKDFEEYGTGIQFSDGKTVDIKKDRLVLFWSDVTKYKPEQFSLSLSDSPNYTCCIVTHFIGTTKQN